MEQAMIGKFTETSTVKGVYKTRHGTSNDRKIYISLSKRKRAYANAVG